MSSRDGFDKKYAEFFSHMFAPESEFGGGFLNTYLRVMKNNSILGTFQYHENIGEMRVENIGDELKIYFYQGEENKQPISV